LAHLATARRPPGHVADPVRHGPSGRAAWIVLGLIGTLAAFWAGAAILV
jgi:hypothetical protein